MLIKFGETILPTYTFKNRQTGEIEEHVMSWTKLQDFKKNNPNLELNIFAENLPIMSDAMRMSVPGTKKADSSFEKYVIAPMKERIPGNTMGGHKTNSGNKEW